MPRRSSSYSSYSSRGGYDKRGSHGHSSSRTISPQFIRGEKRVPRNRSRSPRQRTPVRHEEEGCRLHIADLTADTSKKELEDAFGKYGVLREVWVARNPPCFAFVVYKNEEDAERAMHKVDNTYIGRNKVRVTTARPRTRGTRRNFYDPNMRCYTCGERGHFSRECSKIYKSFRSYNSRSHSRSRSHGRDRGGRNERRYGEERKRRRSSTYEDDDHSPRHKHSSSRRHRDEKQREDKKVSSEVAKVDNGSGSGKTTDHKKSRSPVSQDISQKTRVEVANESFPVYHNVDRTKSPRKSRSKSKSPHKQVKEINDNVNEDSLPATIEQSPRADRSKSPSRSVSPSDEHFKVHGNEGSGISTQNDEEIGGINKVNDQNQPQAKGDGDFVISEVTKIQVERSKMVTMDEMSNETTNGIEITCTEETKEMTVIKNVTNFNKDLKAPVDDYNNHLNNDILQMDATEEAELFDP